MNFSSSITSSSPGTPQLGSAALLETRSPIYPNTTTLGTPGPFHNSTDLPTLITRIITEKSTENATLTEELLRNTTQQTTSVMTTSTTSEAMIPALENTTHFISNVTRELQELLTTVAPVFEETETAPPEIHDDLFQSKMHSTAGWIVFIAICTIGFAIVIALYGPVVFGQKALAKGMECATEFLEFFLPLKYEGKPVDEKVYKLYTKEEFDSKIRRFSAFVGVAITIGALFELIAGSLGRSGFREVINIVDGSISWHEDQQVGGAFAGMCVVCGILTFGLFFTSIQLLRKGFLREMCLVYAIRNAIMCFLFTVTWLRYYGFEEDLDSMVKNVKSFEVKNPFNGDNP